MSIFGERIHRPESDIGAILSDYVTREYIDEQLALRVLKAGDTMTGDLTMTRGRLRGLPTSKIGPRLQGDEAVSQFETVDIITEAFKYLRKTIKPLVTSYAEEYGSLKNGEYEWSFGNGVSGGSSERGYPMAVSGRLKYMSLAITTTSPRRAEGRVEIVINGAVNHSYGVTKSLGQFSSSTEFKPGLSLAKGDMLNFRTATTNSEVTSAVVACILELDIN